MMSWHFSIHSFSSFSTFTCSEKFEFLIVSDNDMRRTGSLVWVYMPFRESDNWPEHGWLRYARWRCSPLNKEQHPVDLYLSATTNYFFEKIRVSRLSAVHKLQYIQLLHPGQHEPGLLVRPEVRRCWSHGVDWLTFSGNNTTIYVRRLLSLPGEGPGVNSRACAECIIRFRSDSWVYMALKSR